MAEGGEKETLVEGDGIDVRVVMKEEMYRSEHWNRRRLSTAQDGDHALLHSFSRRFARLLLEVRKYCVLIHSVSRCVTFCLCASGGNWASRLPQPRLAVDTSIFGLCIHSISARPSLLETPASSPCM